MLTTKVMDNLRALASPGKRIFGIPRKWALVIGVLLLAVAVQKYRAWNPYVSEHRLWSVPFKVESLSFSPDGRHLAACGDGVAKDSTRLFYILDAETGDIVKEVKKSIYPSNPRPTWGKKIVYSPDGKYLAVLYEESISIYETEGYTESHEFPERKAVLRPFHNGSMVFSPDSKLFALIEIQDPTPTSNSKKKRFMVNIHEAKPDFPLLNSIEVRSSSVTMSFTPDGKELACAYGSESSNIYDVATGKNVTELNLPIKGAVNSIRLSGDGGKLIAASTEADKYKILRKGAVFELDLSNHTERWVERFSDSRPILFVEYISDKVFAISQDGNLYVLDGNTGKLLDEASTKLRSHANHVMALSRDKKRMALGSYLRMGIYNVK